MEIHDKAQILNKLGTKDLIEKLHKTEDDLETALFEDASFKNLNYEHLASGTNDCQAVKNILAELAIQAPETGEAGKKLTVADRDAWLIRQRKENKQLSDAIAKQKDVSFLIDNNQIKTDITKKRLEGIKGILALRTAQIRFLSDSD